MMVESTDMALDGLYQEIILDHHKDPRNFGPLQKAEGVAEGFNPVCGDRVEVEVSYGPHGEIKECAFQGEGCSICMASASMMTEEVEGLSKDEADDRIAAFRGFMKGEGDETFKDTDLESLSGVRRFPVRIKCALLPWTTLKDCLSK